MDYYISHEITYEMLKQIGIRHSLLKNEHVKTGTYDTGRPGRQPEWWTSSDFRWKLTLEYIKDVLKYISTHPERQDSMLKSRAILSILFQHETMLSGTIFIGGVHGGKEQKVADIVSLLRGDTRCDWDGKWLYNQENKFEI